MSVINKISKSNDNFISFLENPIVKYSVLIILTLLVILIEKIDIFFLDIFDLDIFKIVYALLIAYTACFDPIYAIVLTTFMIMAIQEVHRRRSTIAITNYKNLKQPLIPSKIIKKNNENDNYQTKQSVVYESMPEQDNDIFINDKLTYNSINKHSLQKIPDVNDTIDAEYDYYEDPAFKTITNNLKHKNTSTNNDNHNHNDNHNDNHNQFFVTDDDLINAQTNIQEGVNQNTSLKAFTPNILNIQGLPNGYDPTKTNLGFL